MYCKNFYRFPHLLFLWGITLDILKQGYVLRALWTNELTYKGLLRPRELSMKGEMLEN
jgi:hypothetical protein